MKPLASPVVEYRTLGLVNLATGTVVGGVAVAIVDKPLGAVARFLLLAAFFGGFMYMLVYRRYVQQAVAVAQDDPGAAREASSVTRRRTIIRTLPSLVLLVALSFLSRSPALIGGIAAGNGAALVAVSRWIHRCERKHAVQILREPRWRWGRQGKLGWGRGRGIMDSQDFYIVRSEPLTVP
jgi:hypothetical protein